MTVRKDVERLSRPALVRLSSLPKAIIPIATIVLLAIGVLAPIPVGMVGLAICFLWVAWLGYLSWPVVGGGQRAIRIVMLLLILAIAGSRFV
ncbi:MAG: hypothetical protein L0G99_09315 [Propionibacteriales bacterium]|nr:hypothetical protein [Propionibacteriales bacterium]